MSSGDISLLTPKGLTHCIMTCSVLQSIVASIDVLNLDARQREKERGKRREERIENEDKQGHRRSCYRLYHINCIIADSFESLYLSAN